MEILLFPYCEKIVNIYIYIYILSCAKPPVFVGFPELINVVNNIMFIYLPATPTAIPSKTEWKHNATMRSIVSPKFVVLNRTGLP